ncbi:hypothetical protein PUR49_09300 [Streptomyces sp. BE147]|uniref:hypothetical protein n=1 Tax=Streptomyces sp. BE147 TaxID=3002524 RepID=UPI002E781FA2|nr:hypothetical protein [Streptomyces sp. BE147]MEE1736699.1 hypothetical protein [Streptomyces sp. BE147]
MISAVLVVGGAAHITHLFRRDHRIRSQGRDVRALVEDVRLVGTNDSGAAIVKYRLSWYEDGSMKYVEGGDTVSVIHSSMVQKGCAPRHLRYSADAPRGRCRRRGGKRMFRRKARSMVSGIAPAISRNGVIVHASRGMPRSPEGRRIRASVRSGHSKIG